MYLLQNETIVQTLAIDFFLTIETWKYKLKTFSTSIFWTTTFSFHYLKNLAKDAAPNSTFLAEQQTVLMVTLNQRTRVLTFLQTHKAYDW